MDRRYAYENMDMYMEYRENEGVTGFRDVTQRAHYSGFYIHRQRERERERYIYIYIYI